MTAVLRISQSSPHTGNPPSEADLQTFKAALSGLIGFDLLKYKSSKIDRRICALVAKYGCKTLGEYSDLLYADSVLLEAFAEAMTVTVTEFFRGTECFREISEHHIQYLLDKNRVIKVWSAGCANGAEIYSLVMMLNEMGIADRFSFYATVR